MSCFLYPSNFVGAASGQHFDILTQMFPSYQFDLYDPRPICCSDAENVRIFTGGMYLAFKIRIMTDPDGWFTEDTCKRYINEGGRGILFISDIRTSNWKNMTKLEVAERVKDVLS